MKKFWAYLISIVLFFILMIALTYIFPGIKNFASGIATKNKLPIWIVGLLAPILYLFKNIGNMLSGILPKSGEETAIKDENQKIKDELEKITQDVKRLDEWRKSEIQIQLQEIQRLKQNVDLLDVHILQLKKKQNEIEGKDPSEFVNNLSDEEVLKLGRYLDLQNGITTKL